MTPSWRKPAGIGLILLLVVIWCAAIVSFAPQIGTWPWPLKALFYLVVGLAWIAPLKPLLTWMETGRWRF